MAVLANVLWYYVKLCLRREGKEVSWFWDHSRDFRLLREAIAEAETEATRKRFERLLFAMYCMPIALVICFGAMVIEFVVRVRG